MKAGRDILITVIGVGLLGGLIGEHLSHRRFERRYQEAVAVQRRVELQYREALATHGQLQRDLEHERQRAHELSDALASTRAQFEETVGRLAEETRSTSELKMRLASLQQQMEQLQGELAATLETRQKGASAEASPGPVRLERVVVSTAGAPGIQGRVLSVHQDWGFVVIDLGWNTVRVGDTVSIFRNNALLAKAKVERVQEGACAATLLPEWKAIEIRANDLVRVL